MQVGSLHVFHRTSNEIAHPTTEPVGGKFPISFFMKDGSVEEINKEFSELIKNAKTNNCMIDFLDVLSVLAAYGWVMTGISPITPETSDRSKLVTYYFIKH